MLVELESPKASPLRQDGGIRQPLHHAVEQIRDWRAWLGIHALSFREETGCWGIVAECGACVVIGRREMRRGERGKRHLRDFERDHINVMSYDRLLERYREQTDWMERQSQEIDELRTSLR